MKTFLSQYCSALIGACLSTTSMSVSGQDQGGGPGQGHEPGWSAGEPVIVFGGADHMQQMKERLSDPGRRSAMREEQLRAVTATHPELGAVLGLDADTERRLLDLLADQQLARLDEVFVAKPGAAEIDLQTQADAENVRIAALRDLLGEEALRRYEEYTATLMERMRVQNVDARLSGPNKLRPEQKQQLIELFREQQLRESERHRRAQQEWSPFSRGGGTLQSREEMQRAAQLQTLRMNEEALALLSETDRLMREGAAEFLTQPQLAALVQMQADNLNRQREWIGQARAAARRDAAIPDPQAASMPPPRAPLSGDLKVTITLKVNGVETLFADTVRNSEPVTFQATEGLVVEATPTLYDDHWLEVRLIYFEQRASGRQRLGGESGIGTPMRLPDGSLNRGGGGGTVVTGSKAYAVEVSASAEAIR